MESLQNILAGVKTRKSVTPSSVQNLGASVHDKIQNMIKDEKTVVTNAFFPEGKPEKAAAMKENFQKKFGFETPAELVSFYEIFDGFELRTVDLENTMPSFMEENKWLTESYNLPADFGRLSMKEWQSEAYQGVSEELQSMLGMRNFQNLDMVGGRTTNPEATDITYYEDHTHMIDEYGLNTVIPSADKLFTQGNKAGEAQGVELYYFDFFTHFNQIVLGIAHGKMHLYQVKYGYGELQKIDEDITAYLKKIIIRGA